MKLILLAVNAINPDKNSYEFASYLGRLTKSKVCGMFLDDPEAYQKLVIKQTHGVLYTDWNIEENSDEYRNKKETIKNNIFLFKEACISSEVSYSIHSEHEVPPADLLEESRFADLIVADASLSLSTIPEGTPSDFVIHILHKANCPVIISPVTFNEIDEIVFTYNGSLSSIFAIKQFTYLIPEYFDKKVTVVQVNKEGKWPLKDQQRLKEWLGNHYTDLHFEALEGNTENELMSFLFNRKNMFLVMGAYGRNSLSEYFKKSAAEILIKTLTQPIFIAHH